MSKSNELKGFKVFIAEYFDGCEGDYGLISEMGGEIRWGRPFSQATNVYSEAELIENCKDVDGLIIIARDVPTQGLFDAAPKLRIISKQGIGLDKVPLGLAADYGILVANTATTVVETVAEHRVIVKSPSALLYRSTENSRFRWPPQGRADGEYPNSIFSNCAIRRLGFWVSAI